MEYKSVELCKVYGIPASTISMALSRGDLVKNSGGRIDDENPRNSAYLASRRLRSQKEALEGDGKTAERLAQTVNLDSLNDLDLAERFKIYPKIMRMTIREAVLKFGGVEGVEHFVKVLRDVASAEEKDQKLRERRLQLIEKDFVVAHVFSYLDFLNRQILESSASIVDEIIALVQSEGGAARQKILKIISGASGRCLVGAKEHINDNISALRVKYQKESDIDERLERIEQSLEG
jgi:hypothetical protein